eukprot:TRINITY_DN13946_c0_g1_i2.p1 TRINITY_DN13946_c0_g1~~TRINITY_DN13946_c0_g1_i2.p1  ORF type:complete len:129 (-),score=37.75 TRINITY_DN13946_c0_g1_i2:60-446(-)
MFAKLFLIFTLQICLSNCRKVKLGGKTCDYNGATICNGAVVEETLFSAMACEGGKIKKKGIKAVKGNPRVGKDTGPGKDCLWYDTVFCDGDIVEDLHRWWFLMKCSMGQFSVYSRSYSEVVADKRFRQ